MVPERIVDTLEAVEVEAEHREVLAAADADERFLQPRAKQGPVRQVGQTIMPRHVGDLRLGGAPVGDILMRRDPSAALERRVAEQEYAAIRLLDHKLARP